MAKGGPRSGKKKKGDNSLYFILAGLAVLGALIFGNSTPDDAPVVPAARLTREQRAAAKRQAMPIGPGSEFYWPWYKPADVTEEWKADDSAWLNAHATNSSSLFEKCDLENVLSDIATPGFHVLCVMPITQVEAQSAMTRVAVFKRGLCSSSPHTSFLVPKSVGSSMEKLVNFVSYRLDMKEKHHPRFDYQRLGLFTRRGGRLYEPMDLFSRPSVLVMEGGQWVWPGVRIGHTAELPDLRNNGEVTLIKTVSLEPKVFEIVNFLKESESDHIIEKAGPLVAKSAVAVKDVDKGKAAADGVDQWRTSLTHFYPSAGDPTMLEVERRVMRLTRVNLSHAEEAQVQCIV
jgi:prolyl 4-hydroxylase